MGVVDLINHLRLEGPHNLEHVLQLVKTMPQPWETSSWTRREILRLKEAFLLRWI